MSVIGRRKLRFIGGLAAISLLAAACGDNGDNGDNGAAGGDNGDEIPSGGEVTQLDLGVIYGAISDRDPCNFGEVFTTDGRISALDLVVLEDDQSFFPLYNVSPVFTQDAHDPYADELAELYAPVTEALEQDVMTELNARASAEGEREQDVAQDFLESNDLLGSGVSLDGADFTVGSKDFDEQLILGYISLILLEDAGASVTDEVNVGGTDTTRAALETGDIDHYWEYNGTAWISFFGETDPIPDRMEQYEAVAERDLEEAGLVWLDPAPFNNTYGIALSSEAADELGTESISDLVDLIAENPDDATMCVEAEFAVRDDGLPGLEEHYGFQIG
jgi:glycine betaine/choline ABC-type transport system substrate-binding protein